MNEGLGTDDFLWWCNINVLHKKWKFQEATVLRSAGLVLSEGHKWRVCFRPLPVVCVWLFSPRVSSCHLPSVCHTRQLRLCNEERGGSVPHLTTETLLIYLPGRAMTGLDQPTPYNWVMPYNTCNFASCSSFCGLFWIIIVEFFKHIFSCLFFLTII